MYIVTHNLFGIYLVIICKFGPKLLNCGAEIHVLVFRVSTALRYGPIPKNSAPELLLLEHVCLCFARKFQFHCKFRSEQADKIHIESDKFSWLALSYNPQSSSVCEWTCKTCEIKLA